MKYLLIICLILSLASEANAYVDPGSLGWITQALLAILGGIVVFFKSILMSVKKFLLYIKNIFKKKK